MPHYCSLAHDQSVSTKQCVCVCACACVCVSACVHNSPLLSLLLELGVHLRSIHGGTVVKLPMHRVHPTRVLRYRHITEMAEEVGEADDLAIFEAQTVHQAVKLGGVDGTSQSGDQDAEEGIPGGSAERRV